MESVELLCHSRSESESESESDPDHAQWVFTIPKILRGYFLRNRELLGDLSRASWETVRAMMAEAAGDPGVRPGMVVVPQTWGSSVNAHPHVHAIVSRGAWTRDGTWVPIPYVDSGAAARLFRHKVLRLLVDAELIDEDRVAMILGWRHTSGFSVHNEVVVQADDGAGLERLARYLARPPVSLQRMEWDRETGEVVYRTGRGHAEERGSDDGRRGDEVDPLLCPCGATMRIVAVITERSVITKTLGHLAKVAAASATEGAGPGPARPPPPRAGARSLRQLNPWQQAARSADGAKPARIGTFSSTRPANPAPPTPLHPPQRLNRLYFPR